ncbi:hypothetical protein CANTEDRAFT_115302 [Yamadazyma tenuis ATCC 10573]|uniref:Bul1 C-terminal domain-containing protein n=2 Tax=Candida tenuis TaxID=2315449 RepID=G3B9A9_CANTC|nr:uncharacterized protein CANTEDRAFT_115302 [Yamadazyma tenuis ATCC 10573]EGV61854.1 hypothetical protein CANTEDRAFT_115302 [Yamadazyma tenuis ATCC 10573]
MCYENNSKEGDDFDHLVIQRFQKYARELSEILHTVPKEDIGLDEETIKDIKCLANLKTHTVSLKIKDPVVLSHDQPTILNSIPWSDETFTASNQQQQKRFFKEFKVKIDIANTVMKKYQSTDFKLIPDFQSCFMGRYYAIQINLKNVNRETLSLKVPLVIQHPFDSQ